MKYYAIFDENKKLIGRFDTKPELPDAIEISKEDFLDSIASPQFDWYLEDSGKLTPKPVPVEDITLTKDQVENNRLLAYADPVNGSDRYFIESVVLQAQGLAKTSPEVKKVIEIGLEKKKQIQSNHPYPSE